VLLDIVRLNIARYRMNPVIIVPPLAVLVFEIVYDVVLRYVFNRPTIWSFDLSAYIFGAFFILGGAYTLRHRAHVNMDVIYLRLTPRTRAALDVVTSFLFFLFCGIMLWKGAEVAWHSIQIRETTATLWHPPVYIVRLVVPIGAFLILLQGLAKLIRDLHMVISGRETI